MSAAPKVGPPGCAVSARARQVALPTASAGNEAEPGCGLDGQGQNVGRLQGKGANQNFQPNHRANQAVALVVQARSSAPSESS